jgi:hypothetical protein
MDSGHKLRFVRRQWLDRVILSVRDWLIHLSDSLSTETGLLIEVDCPHCYELNPVSEPLQFGKMYELTCSMCLAKFTLIIPRYVVRKGLIEESLYGQSGDQSRPKPVDPRTVRPQ